MKILCVLQNITGLHYSLFTIFRSPRALRIDSLTFIELVLRAEKIYDCTVSADMMTKLLSVPLVFWKRNLRFSKREKKNRGRRD